jgi:hypothetical protein
MKFEQDFVQVREVRDYLGIFGCWAAARVENADYVFDEQGEGDDYSADPLTW